MLKFQAYHIFALNKLPMAEVGLDGQFMAGASSNVVRGVQELVQNV